MSLLLSLVVAFIILYSAFTGTKRGMILIGLELVSIVIATAIALTLYPGAGSVMKSGLHMTISLANIAGFVIIWGIVEVICAVVIRFVLLPHLGRHLQLSAVNRIGGAVLNTIKAGAIITISLIMFSALPFSPATKSSVEQAFLPRQFLAASTGLQTHFAPSLSRDFRQSLSVFTITSEPESEQRIELGFSTTKVTVDAASEDAMLILINHERTTRGFRPLIQNPKARSVARTYSATMFARGFFSHVDLSGKTPFDRMTAGGVSYNSAGENLALAPTLQQAHDGLMKSPGHRANILSPRYHTIGIGIVDGGLYGLMITQNFTD